MKITLVIYAIIAILFQVLMGELTGLGQGSFGFLTFIFLVELDPRYRFRYVGANIKKHHNQKGEQTNE